MGKLYMGSLHWGTLKLNCPLFGGYFLLCPFEVLLYYSYRNGGIMLVLCLASPSSKINMKWGSAWARD